MHHAPSMDYTYEQLSPDDVAAFKELNRVFGEAFDDVETYQAAAPDDAYLRSLLEMPHFIVLVALHEGSVVGGLTAYVLDKYERARAEVYIYDLAVAEPHRRKGIARQLIQSLKPIAKQKGAWVIFVQADPPDDPAVRLYTSLGTREDVYHFDIDVS